MPDYNLLTTESIEVMKKSAGTFATDLKNLKSSKGDKNKIKQLETTLDLKYKNIGAAYLKQINTAESGLKKMAVYVEELLSSASKLYSNGKETLANFKKTRGEKDYEILTGLPGMLEHVKTQAYEEMTKFAESWDQFRQFNANIPLDYVSEGNTVRTRILDETKAVRLKVDKIGLAAEQAKMMVTQAKDLQGSTVVTEGTGKLAEAEQLVAQLQKQVLTLTLKTGVASVLSTQATWAKKFTVDKGLEGIIKAAKPIYQNNVVAVQGFSTILSNMEKLYKNAQTVIDAKALEDEETATTFQTATEIMEKWRTEVGKAKSGIPKMALALTQAEQKLKGK